MKVGNSSLVFKNVYCNNSSVVVGPIESQGPLTQYFDIHYDNPYCNETSFEKAEMAMFEDSFNTCLKKNKISDKDVDLIIYSDLNNQVVIGSYCLRKRKIPALGIYSACSGLTEGIIIAGSFLEEGKLKKVIVGVSSHNGTSERQFRYPIEYGGKKSPTTTYTVTSANHLLLSNQESDIKVSRVTIGKINDNGITDPSDMGRAMAIAAYDTFKEHFSDFNIAYDEYDLIMTGDLSKYGSDLFLKYLEEDGITLNNYTDSGLLIYGKNQKVFAGGSGCGCVASVTLGCIFHKLRSGSYKKVLVLATGALLNPVMIMQKESIPSVCHAVCFERV